MQFPIVLGEVNHIASEFGRGNESECVRLLKEQQTAAEVVSCRLPYPQGLEGGLPAEGALHKPLPASGIASHAPSPFGFSRGHGLGASPCPEEVRSRSA